MKKLDIALTFILTLVSVSATQAQKTLSVTGGIAEGSGGSLSYTVGQVFYRFNSAENGSEAQGVHQPYEISVTTAIEEYNGILLEIMVYPNPVNDFLILKVDNNKPDNLSFKLYDTNGILKENRKIISNETDIIMKNLPPGIYFLKVTDNQQELKIFKIIKK